MFPRHEQFVGCMVLPLMYIQLILARMQMLSDHMLDQGVTRLGLVETGVAWSIIPTCN